MNEIINFNNVNNKFNYGAELIIEVYNDNNKLIDKYKLYVKMFSNMTVFSLKKPKSVINNYSCLIYTNIETNNALLLEISDKYSGIYIGFYKDKIFKPLTNYVYFGKEMTLMQMEKDSILNEENISIKIYLDLLEKINNKYMSRCLLQKI